MLEHKVKILAMDQQTKNPKKAPTPGILAGNIRLGSDFDAPLPDDLRHAFEGSSTTAPIDPILPRRVLTRNPSHVIHKADRYPNRCAASFGDAHQVTSRTNTSCQHARWCEKTIPRIAEQGRMGVQMDGAY